MTQPLPQTISIIENAQEALELEFKLISSSFRTIEIIFSSANIFYVQQKLGIIHALKDAAIERRVSVRILTPKDGNIKKIVQKIKKDVDSFDAHYFTYNSDIRTKTLIFDRAKSLVMEINQGQERSDYDEAILKKEAEELLSFNDKIIGLSAYSISKSTVLSYAATFETLWKEAELHEQVRESNKHLEAANQELESTNRQLALANEHMKVNDEIQKDFINVAAHELRTPTQSILGYAQMLCMEPERGRQYLSPILRNAERLQRLTGDILDVTKIESRTLSLNMEPLNL